MGHSRLELRIPTKHSPEKLRNVWKILRRETCCENCVVVSYCLHYFVAKLMWRRRKFLHDFWWRPQCTASTNRVTDVFAGDAGERLSGRQLDSAVQCDRQVLRRQFERSDQFGALEFFRHQRCLC